MEEQHQKQVGCERRIGSGNIAKPRNKDQVQRKIHKRSKDRAGRDDRGLDNAGVDAHLHGGKHVTAGKVDSARLLEIEGDARALSGDKGVYHAVNVTAGKVVGFHLVDVELKTRLGSLDQGVDYPCGAHLPYLHTDKGAEAHAHARGRRADPKAEGHEGEEQDEENYRGDDDHGDPPKRSFGACRNGEHFCEQFEHGFILLIKIV